MRGPSSYSAEMQAALFFHPDAVEGDGLGVVGRRVAGLSFLRAFWAFSPRDPLQIVTASPEHAASFRALAATLTPERQYNLTVLEDGETPPAGAIFMPGPDYMGLDWARQRGDTRRFSLIGITHSLSTRRSQDSLRRLLTNPVETWDALICTSRAAHQVAMRQMDIYGRYLGQRFQAGRMPMPQMPVIPLGVHPEDFRRDMAARTRLRTDYEVGPEDLVLLSLGRLSSVEKAHPAPLLHAAEQVAQQIGGRLHLWIIGWAARPEEETLHKAAAARLAPSVQVRIFDGNIPEMRRDIWSGADVFTIPLDSLQESFGLVAVEAMAAGLPVVLPNWNGVRDTVLDGETGFLVPTWMAHPGAGQILADRYIAGQDSYVQHLSLVQQQVATDPEAYVAALLRLARDPALRETMGRAGKRHVNQNLAWSRLFPTYLALARQLHELRQNGTRHSPHISRETPPATAIDPFDLFAAYPSDRIADETWITPLRLLSEAEMGEWDEITGRTLYNRWIAPSEAIQKISRKLCDAGACRFDDACQITGLPAAELERALLLLAKFGLVSLSAKSESGR